MCEAITASFLNFVYKNFWCKKSRAVHKIWIAATIFLIFYKIAGVL